METIRTIRTVLTVAILLSTLLPGASFLASIFGINPHSLQIHPVAAANLNNFLGFDCAYGANGDGLPFPTSITASAPYTGVDTDNSLESVCQATELADQDGFAHPLLGDNPGIVAAGSGGGITVDIVITTLNTTINGYDLTVGYDTKVLNAVKVDQTGLPFGGNTACPGTPPSSCTLQTANSIDQTNGIVRVAQALLGVSLGPGSVTCNTVSDPSCNTANQELFRIRFDIVGAGNSALTIPAPGGTDVITNPTTVKHNDLPGAVSTDSLFDLIDVVTGIGYSASFTFSPNPEVPGSPLTFTATAACTACTGALTFSWAFATLDNVYPATPYVIQATGPTVTFTAPPPVIYRVALTVTDGAAHTALAVRSLPIRAAFSGTNALSQGVPGGSWSGSWLGGVVTGTSGYAGTWRFCPGTALSHPVCSVGPLTAPLTQNPPSITQTASQGAITYNFAGLYTAFLSIHDTAEAQLGTLPTTIVSPFQINVTSATPTFAYTVATVPNATTLTLPNAAVNVTATVAYAGTYPLASQSSTFSYIFNWGDGLQTSVTGGKAVFGIHTYTSAGSFVIKVIAKETSFSGSTPTPVQGPS